MYGEEGLTQQGGGHGGFHDPFDIFAQHFGGGNRQQQQSNKKPEVLIPLEVTLEELYNGATHRVWSNLHTCLLSFWIITNRE